MQNVMNIFNSKMDVKGLRKELSYLSDYRLVCLIDNLQEQCINCYCYQEMIQVSLAKLNYIRARKEFPLCLKDGYLYLIKNLKNYNVAPANPYFFLLKKNIEDNFKYFSNIQRKYENVGEDTINKLRIIQDYLLNNKRKGYQILKSSIDSVLNYCIVIDGKLVQLKETENAYLNWHFEKGSQTLGQKLGSSESVSKSKLYEEYLQEYVFSTIEDTIYADDLNLFQEYCSLIIQKRNQSLTEGEQIYLSFLQGDYQFDFSNSIYDIELIDEKEISKALEKYKKRGK